MNLSQLLCSITFATINPVDVAVIEAGIGGTFDSTNVFTAETIRICPSISIDHQETLGKTLTEIAGHAAGVLNPHVPFILGQMTPEVQKVFHQKTKELNCPTYELDKEFSIREMVKSLIFIIKI